MSCIMNNQKTIKSLDLSTNCPKRARGEACSYCYVESARAKGFNAKKVIDKIEYTSEILRMTQPTIDKLNATGGLRVFSFGDYMDWMYEDMLQICKDAQAKGLKLKAITKVPQFVELFHSYFNIIHVSIDNVGDGVNWDQALALREKYTNVLIRSAIMSHEDIEVLEPISDILTFNHADIKGYTRFKPSERVEFAKQYEGKVCCETSSCATCKVKCGEEAVISREIALALWE